MQTKQMKPRKIHIDVTESGTKTSNIRLPYGMFKLGMKYGRSATKGETDGCAQAMAQLGDFDCVAFERSVANGAILLPHQLLDTIDPDHGTHVIITAE